MARHPEANEARRLRLKARLPFGACGAPTSDALCLADIYMDDAADIVGHDQVTGDVQIIRQPADK